jgi:hypothetical protein
MELTNLFNQAKEVVSVEETIAETEAENMYYNDNDDNHIHRDNLEEDNEAQEENEAHVEEEENNTGEEEEAGIEENEAQVEANEAQVEENDTVG